MIRTFINIRNTEWNELFQVDTESGKVKIYCVDKEFGFPFEEYYTTITEMGYKSIADIIARMKTRKEEVETDRQNAKEVTGLLKLAKYRADHGRYTYIKLKDGTKYNDIKKCFKTVCKLANVQNLRFHDLRHTGATRMVAAGVPITVVKQILNHASIQTTMRYAHTMREQEISAVEALANFV